MQFNRVAENADEIFELDFTLMADELTNMLSHLTEVLGGETKVRWVAK